MHRLPLVALTLSAAFFSVTAHRYFSTDVRDVMAIGRKPMLLTEFSQGVPVTELFTFPRERLRSIAVAIWSEQPVTLDVELELRRAMPGEPNAVVGRARRTLSQPAGEQWHTFDLDVLPRSRDQIYTARWWLRAATGPSQPIVGRFGLMASADDALTTGRLFVGDSERWGDVAFMAQADPRTRLGRMLLALDEQLPREYRPGRTGLIALLVFYGVLTVAVGVVAASLTPRQTHLPEARPMLATVSRVAGVYGILLVGGTLALAASLFANRERVALDMLRDIDSAAIEAPQGLHGAVFEVSESINGLDSRAVFAHPPSRVSWQVAVPAGTPLLRTAVALRWYVWEGRSDGVTFNIQIQDGDLTSTAYTKFVNPAEHFEDRAWIPVEVDLSRYAGRAVRITLETTPGPSGDPSYDWAMWAHPRIVEAR